MRLNLSNSINEDARKHILNEYLGEYVLVRSCVEGINAGVLLSSTRGQCILGEARRLWDHSPLDPNTSWYEGVANTGLSPESKISVPTSHPKIIMEDYSITPCTEEAEKSIRNHPAVRSDK